MIRPFNLNTVKILSIANQTNSSVYALVIGKVIGGNRLKRRWIYLSKEDYRDIKLRELGL